MSLCSGQITGDMHPSLANFYQLINCCNILCVTEYVTMYLYFISGYYNTEYAWSSYTYLSSCTYMQICRVDLSCMPGLPTFHMHPTPLYSLYKMHFTAHFAITKARHRLKHYAHCTAYGVIVHVHVCARGEVYIWCVG